MSRVFTIAAGTPFLRALAQGLLARHPTTDDPFALAGVSVYLPTQRAVRALEEAFLETLAEKPAGALLLPRLKALGEADEEALLFAPSTKERSDAIPPAISQSERLLRLAELLRALAPSLEDALLWAKSLARLLDEVAIEEADLGAIGNAIPAELSAHFDTSRKFLEIVSEAWPAILEEDGVIERAERRRRLMEAETRALKQEPPSALYIAGSTGSVPATQRLMAAALSLAGGHVVLPGLNRTLDERAWGEIDESHPQAGLRRLLTHLGLQRKDVADWAYTEEPVAEARLRLLSEVLRPAPTTDSWARTLDRFSVTEALAGLSLLIARDRAQEARAIALAMRECLERPDATAALVTPDRALARRVGAELARWGIEVDDSAGVPLMETSPARLLRLILDAITERFAPVPLLALLKHPLVELAGGAGAIGELERHALRGRRPTPGLAGVRARLAEERQEALNLIAALEVVLSSLMNIAGRTASVSKWAAALGAAGEALAPKFWVGPAGDAMSELLAEIGAASGPPLTLKDFGVLLAEAARGRAVRPRARAHPRLAIWGPLEARLQSADLIILGALNEGVWPAIPDVDPWANRAMRKAMGLSPPERWVGVAAHDFEALAAAHHVLLTAAERVDGSPSRPSRFLMRLQNFLSPRGGRALLAPPPHAGWARQLVRAEVYRPVAPPAPKPPVVMRPRKFSITEIATLRRDPYAIYTKHVLRLKPLEPIDADTLARDRGNLLHAILEKFVRAYPDALPADARAAFDKIAAAQLAQEQIEPEAAPLIRARLSRAATKYLEWEVTHRLSARPLDQEAKGAIDLPVPGGTVRLTGRIDRIDADRATGAALIFDYKTGRTPSKRQVEAMLEPQLPLGALIALKGGLETAHPRAVMRLAYLQIGGGAGEIEEPRFDDAQPLIDETWAELLKLLASYDDQAKPYRSWAIREREHDRGDYDLLARLAEWRNSGGDE